MNGCEHSIDLGPYLDGELTVCRRAAMEAHLGRCASCRSELAQLRALAGAVADAPQPQFPPQALSRLHGQVNAWLAEAVRAEREAERAERGVLRLTRVLTGLAASVLLAGSLWLVRSRQPVPHAIPEVAIRPVESWERSALSGPIAVDGDPAQSSSIASAADSVPDLMPGGLVDDTAGFGGSNDAGRPVNDGSN